MQEVETSDKSIENQSYPIPGHGEPYCQQQGPDFVWFYCLKAPTIRCESVLCVGKLLFDELSSATKKLFRRNRLRYLSHFSFENGECVPRNTIREIKNLANKIKIPIKWNKVLSSEKRVVHVRLGMK